MAGTDKSAATANAYLALLFNGTAWANIADNAAASPITTLYVALHTANPGESGNQTTGETSYTNYNRVGVARSSTAAGDPLNGWTVTAGSVSPINDILFPTCGVMPGGRIVITHVSVGTAASGAGVRLYQGPITPNINVDEGIQPHIANSTTIAED